MSADYSIASQILGSALRSIAQEMHTAIVRSASSPNITERRDCSTALFLADGTMLTQADSIPVHLGAMPDAVAAVRARGIGPGEAWILNDPFAGGTHLPDLTIVSAYAPPGEGVLALAVSRAHHSDVGGMSPGSMPAMSRDLLQEGLVIPPVCLIRDGQIDASVMAILLANTRTPVERTGDLRAQVAAHRLADNRLGDLVAVHGRRQIEEAGRELIAYADRRMRAAIADLPNGRYVATDVIEGDGANEEDLPIVAAVTVDGDRLVVDFTGTAPEGRGNLNCPVAVTRSAVYFVTRLATDPDIPASEGAFAAVDVIAPPGSLINASPGRAVVGGNVETSSRIVDVVMAALAQATKLPAAGQGTMNNLTIGGRGPSGPFTYYETIGGGQGASPAADGPSGVHVAMSNTLNTPIESLETAYPLRVVRYALRPGTGGGGAHRGGDGVERVIRVLVDTDVSIISERRRHRPPGRAGGDDGATGENLVNGRPVPAKWSGALCAGDEVTVRTPGGGGYGPQSMRVSATELSTS